MSVVTVYYATNPVKCKPAGSTKRNNSGLGGEGGRVGTCSRETEKQYRQYQCNFSIITNSYPGEIESHNGAKRY